MAKYFDSDKLLCTLRNIPVTNAMYDIVESEISYLPTADVIEREKVVEDMKTLYDKVYHLVKTENWNKEREIESKIITQALSVINGCIENYTKE